MLRQLVIYVLKNTFQILLSYQTYLIIFISVVIAEPPFQTINFFRTGTMFHCYYIHQPYHKTEW